MTKRRAQNRAVRQDGVPAQGDVPVFPVHEHIGRQLKAAFEEVVSQPVPDKFRQLLEQLQRKQSGK
jgi:hypothetical protein